MTVGNFALGLGIVLMLVQLGLFFNAARGGALSQGLKVTMLAMAIFPPVFAYLAFSVFWPELGAQALSG
ncbi:hypothetical protein [Altererythrobacter sp. GH1-8]|uniref:hypothetical protein n=1 Tax=Altererythrobacter sp. GH1-8 TaxID=3349333 RepID=UPI00374DEF78